MLDISGALAGSGHAWEHRAHLPAAGVDAGFEHTPVPLGALHGRELVARLERENATRRYGSHFASHRGDAAALDHLIEATALRHRIVSRRTSLVAIAEEPSVDPRAPRRRTRLVVEVPAGVSAEGVGLERGGELFLSIDMDIEVQRKNVVSSLQGEVLSRQFRNGLRQSLAKGSAGQRRKLRAPMELEVAGACWFAPDILVIELVLPFEGFVGHGGPIELTHELRDGRVVKLDYEVVPGMSTEPESGKAGRIVKLALRLLPEASSFGAGAFVGEWIYLVQGPEGGPIKVPVRIRLDVPEPGESGALRPDAGPGR
jgi:hypothetical protein